jgi:hypothetical protein
MVIGGPAVVLQQQSETQTSSTTFATQKRTILIK